MPNYDSIICTSNSFTCLQSTRVFRYYYTVRLYYDTFHLSPGIGSYMACSSTSSTPSVGASRGDGTGGRGC